MAMRKLKKYSLMKFKTTLIGPDCGTREALESIGVDEAEQERILMTIHHHTENRNG